MTEKNFKLWLHGYLLGAGVDNTHVKAILEQFDKIQFFKIEFPINIIDKKSDKDVIDEFMEIYRKQKDVSPTKIYPPIPQPWYPPKYPSEPGRVWLNQAFKDSGGIVKSGEHHHIEG